MALNWHGPPSPLLFVLLCTARAGNDTTAARPKLFFVHVWKAGGTSLASMARRNNETTHHQPSTKPLGRFASWPRDATFIEAANPAPPFLFARGADGAPFRALGWRAVVLLREPLRQALSLFLQHHLPLDEMVEYEENEAKQLARSRSSAATLALLQAAAKQRVDERRHAV